MKYFYNILLVLGLFVTIGYGKDARTSNYETVERGHLFDLDYRIFIKGPDGLISPWHDIPLYADKANKIYNMVVEIPRWSNAKMEMSTHDSMSPIKQDVIDGQPRFISNIFPYHGYICNYGALPQTWEDVNYTDPNTNTTGDGDPIDVVEIGDLTQPRGSVIQVKILGVLGLLDSGETDWKLIAMSTADPLASKINDIGDVEKFLPGLLKATREWFRVYKTPTGARPNKFAFHGEYQDAEFARKIITDTHKAWKTLIADPNPPYNTECHVPNAVFPAEDKKWAEIVAASPMLGEPATLPSMVNDWIHLPSRSDNLEERDSRSSGMMNPGSGTLVTLVFVASSVAVILIAIVVIANVRKRM